MRNECCGEIGARDFPCDDCPIPTRANNERVEGYLDGLDAGSPEPSANRTASYRHGFTVGGADLAKQPAFGSAAAAREHSKKAEQEDNSA